MAHQQETPIMDELGRIALEITTDELEDPSQHEESKYEGPEPFDERRRYEQGSGRAISGMPEVRQRRFHSAIGRLANVMATSGVHSKSVEGHAGASTLLNFALRARARAAAVSSVVPCRC